MRLITPPCLPRTTPEAAFDALHAHCSGPVVRQIELLTGNPRLARRAVRHAFALAWQRWPAVAVDPDPVGWVRAAAHDYALAPWQRWVPGRRPRRRAPAGPEAALRTALLRLPPAARRAVLLYDGLGLDLPETAAETAASTPAAAGRIMRARAALGEEAAARLGALVSEPSAAGPDAPTVRRRSEFQVRRQTLGAVALTAAVAVTAGVTAALDPAPRREVPPTASVPASTQAPTPAPTQAPTKAPTQAPAAAPVREVPQLRRDAPRCAPYDVWCGAVVPREPFH